MKKLSWIILLFLILMPRTLALNLNISSQSAILYNLDSGEVLYEKNADEIRPIASLTKIMTALVVLDNIKDLDQQVVLISDDFKGLAKANAVTAGFTKGEIVTYRDLLYGLLLPSGADAAKALARTVAGGETEFIKKMNDKVKTLNLKHTHFSTVIGLDDKDNYSTAKEVSLLFKEALKDNNFKKIITTDTYKTTDGKITFHSTIQSNAKKFELDIPYILGGKTGTTTDAGLCLATIAKANDVNYLLITLGATYDKKAPHHIEDAKTIYDYFINNYQNKLVVSKNESFKQIKAKYSSQKFIKLYPENNITLYLPKDYNKKEIKLVYNGQDEVTVFDKKGDHLGTLKIYYQDKLLDTQKITLKENLNFSATEFIKENIFIVIIPLLMIFIIIMKKKVINPLFI